MIVITDPADKDLELPTPEDLLFNFEESKDQIFSILDSLHNMFENTNDNSSILTLAIDWAYKIIKNIGGRIFIL